MSSTVTIGLTGSWGGPALINSANGNGYFLQQDSAANRLYLFRLVAGAQSAQVGAFIANTEFPGMTLKIERTNSSGLIRAIVNGVEVGTFTDATTSTNRAAAISQGIYLTTLTSEFTPAQIIDSITDPLVAGAAGSGFSTGFTGGAGTISSNGISATTTVTAGAAQPFSFNWPIAVDAQHYPTLPKTGQIITLTVGAESATITADLDLAAGMEVVNLVSPITDDDTYPGYYFDQDGFTAEGAQFVFTPYSDLTMDDDGEIEVTGAGDLIGYLIPATGTGAGNAYYYTFQISDGGAVVSGGRPLTSVGLTLTGLTQIGLASVGLC
jgi:hypothetical protein